MAHALSEWSQQTCDPFAGTRVIDRTAACILDVLTASTGMAVMHDDVDRAILAGGGQVSWKMAAVRALRNCGWVIDIVKGRHLTTYRLAGTPDEVENYRGATVREVYSRIVGVGRMLSGQVAMNPADLVANQSLRMAQLMAITLGGDTAVSRTTAEALADLNPLPIP